MINIIKSKLLANLMLLLAATASNSHAAQSALTPLIQSASTPPTQSAQENTFIPATVIANENYKGTVLSGRGSRLEGWVLTNHIIGIDGKVQQVVTIDSSGREDLIHRTHKHINNYQFSPAVDNGQSVISSQQQFMRYRVAIAYSSNQDISASFSNRYNEADNLMIKKRFTEAKEVLDALEFINSKNLKEQALTAWLQSIYYASQSDWPAYGHAVKVATYLRAHLPTKMAIRTSQNLFEWYKFKKQYADAIQTLIEMADIENAEIDEATHQAMLAPVLLMIENQTMVEIKFSLKEHQAWLHRVSRSTINLSAQSKEEATAAIERAEVRCDNAWHRLDVTNLVAFTIPKEDKNCKVLVKASPGVIVSYVEQGDIR